MVEIPEELFQEVLELLTWSLRMADNESELCEDDLEVADRFAHRGGYHIYRNQVGSPEYFGGEIKLDYFKGKIDCGRPNV